MKNNKEETLKKWGELLDKMGLNDTSTTKINIAEMMEGKASKLLKEDMNKEDYNIIAPDNKVWDFRKWMENPNMNDNDVSENPYPVMYVEGKPVWEGDKLIFNGDDNGKPYQTLREVKWQHRAIINGNPDWIKLWSWSVKPKQ